MKLFCASLESRTAKNFGSERIQVSGTFGEASIQPNEVVDCTITLKRLLIGAVEELDCFNVK